MRLKIEKLVYGGSGVGYVDNLPFFVPATVPGDEVDCEVTKRHKGYCEAKLVHIVKASPNRVTPKCEHFGLCGGCQWQHIDYAAQILWKQLILEEQLKRIGKIEDPKVFPTIPSPKIWNYRGRVKLQRDKNGRKGFYALGTHDLVEIKECLIADLNNSFQPEHFTQVNPLQNENLKKLVAEIAQNLNSKRILELYCGDGNLTFSLSKLAERIDAFDSDRRAILKAQRLSEELGSKNARFYASSAVSAIAKIAGEGGLYDTLLTDPPRDGCKDLLKFIPKTAVQNIIYVSCNPSTLARDLKDLIAVGYHLDSSRPIDMFPQTFHIESVNILKKSKK